MVNTNTHLKDRGFALSSAITSDSELSLNIRSINSKLVELYKQYQISFRKINGQDLFGSTQIMQLSDENDVSVPYGQGSLIVRNGIDKLKYLIDNRSELATVLGVDDDELYSNRRDLDFINECMEKLDVKYDIGNSDEPMQLYVSKVDNNTESISESVNWIDYIMTKDWVDTLTESTICDSIDVSSIQDFRIKYISDFIRGWMKDHEIDYHKSVEDFDETLYLDAPNGDKFTDAYNRLNSIDRVDYLFYEVFKPIGGTTNERYVNVKLSTAGTLDISGVLSLSDCEHIEWEYGSMEYLRSLNNDNQRYDFKLSIPFNEGGSKLYWKPDEPEEIVSSTTKGINCVDVDKVRRVFQKRDIQQSDVDYIVESCNEVIENIRKLDNEDSTEIINQLNSIIQSIQDLYTNSEVYEQQTQMNELIQEWQSAVDRVNSLYETVSDTDEDGEIDDDDDDDDDDEEQEEEGGDDEETTEDDSETKYRYYKEYETERYLRWFGTDYIPRFDLDGILKKSICSIPVLSNDTEAEDVFENTDNVIENPDFAKATIDTSTTTTLLSIAPKSTIDIINKDDDNQYLRFIVGGNQQTSNISFHIIGKQENKVQEINHYVATLNRMNDLYVMLAKEVKYLQIVKVNHPSIEEKFVSENEDEDYIPLYWMVLLNKLENMIWKPSDVELLRMRQIDLDSISSKVSTDIDKRNNWLVDAKIDGKEIYDENLYKYINEYGTSSFDSSTIESVSMSDDDIESLNEMLDYVTDYDKWGINYETTVGTLRERIQTYNNLIVRLPINTDYNKLTSKHIFLDWKNYVDKSLEYLVSQGLLYMKPKIVAGKVVEGVYVQETGTGTDGVSHTYYEYYTENIVIKTGEGDDATYSIDNEKESSSKFIDYSYCVDSNDKVIHDRWDYWTSSDFE